MPPETTLKRPEVGRPSVFDRHVAEFYNLLRTELPPAYHWVRLKPGHPFAHPTMARLAELYMNIPSMTGDDLVDFLGCTTPMLKHHLYGNPNLSPGKRPGLLKILATRVPLTPHEQKSNWKIKLVRAFADLPSADDYRPLQIEKVRKMVQILRKFPRSR